MPIALSGQHVPCVHKGRIIGSVKDQRVGTARGLMSTVHWNLFLSKGAYCLCKHYIRIIGSVKDQRVGTARGLMSTVHWNLFYQKALTASVSTINLLVLDRKRGSVQRRKTAYY